MSGSVLPSASLADMQAWARGIMVRQPDFVIGDDYLRRWYVVPRNPFCNVYLHHILHSDDDRAMHDHPWANRSIVLEGSYLEHTPDGAFLREAGDIVDRPAEALHRLEIMTDGELGVLPATTLFMTGPKVREWGFACPRGWVPWEQFTAAADPGQVGRGCGEMA